MLKLRYNRNLEQCQKEGKAKQSIPLQSFGNLSSLKSAVEMSELVWYNDAIQLMGFKRQVWKPTFQRGRVSEREGPKDMQIAVLRSQTTTHKSTRCKEHRIRTDWTIQPSKTEIQVSGQLSDRECCFIPPYQPLLRLPIIYWISMKRLDGKKKSVYLLQVGVAATELE